MDIKRVAVIGAGVMGLGIAQVITQADFDVVLRSRRVARALSKFRENIRKAAEKNILDKEKVDAMLSRIECTSDLSKAGIAADLVIEAVVEDLPIKARVFRELDESCPPHTILTTNTSSLSINDLAEVTKRQEKVIGLHFFNPAFSMKLVEVIPTSSTSKETIETVLGFSKCLGKIPIVVKESPGFVVNRLLIPMINEAIRLLMEGVTTAEDIDMAMKLGANHPIGPLALADFIGLDVCLEIMKNLWKAFGSPNYQPCPLLEEMVQKGYTGRKAGKGFFQYPEN